MFWLKIVGYICATVFSVYFLFLTIRNMAKLNFFFTFVPENRGKIVLHGDKYHKTIIAKRGFSVDNAGEITEKANLNTEKEPLLVRLLGIYSIGIPPFANIFRYDFDYVTVKLGEEGQEGGMGYIPIRKSLRQQDTILLSDYPYFMTADGAETAELLPLDVKFLVTSRIINPYLAIFRSTDWLRQMTTWSEGAARNFIGVHKYDYLVKNEEQGRIASPTEVKDAFEKYLLKALKEDMKANYGVEVVSATLIQISPPAAFVETTTKIYTAVQTADAEKAASIIKIETAKNNARAAIETAEGTKQAAILTMEGQAEGLKKVAAEVKAAGVSGKRVLNAQIIKDAGPNTKYVVTALSDLGDKVIEKLGGK